MLNLYKFVQSVCRQFSYNQFNTDRMGRRGNKWRGKPHKKVKTDWKCNVIPQEHQLFRQYYQQQLELGEQDFQQFWQAMKVKLPVVFRINPNSPNLETFKAKIRSEDFIKQITSAEMLQELSQKKEDSPDKAMSEEIGHKKQVEEMEPTELCKFELINWYPGEIVYSLNTTKQIFKKSRMLAELHQFLQKCFDSGLISRQELVSMIPPLYLNIQPHDTVLDMCAAPGSKTSQLLEMMYKERRELTMGCVVANDADYSRAQMLIHQLHRSGTAGMAVINHPGQFMPELHVKKVGSIKRRFQFDKVLCDVPCSGDGATRKLPIKWATWHTTDGQVLHPLQLSILMKGLKLLKKDGYLVYSTCSLNPIENEAVINGLFQKVERGLELVDIHPIYAIKGRRGLKNWGVYAIVDEAEGQKGGKEGAGDGEEDKEEGGQGTKQGKINNKENGNPGKDNKQGDEDHRNQIKGKAPHAKLFSKKCLKQFLSYEQAKHIQRIKPTMFPSEEQRNLHYTMRILPHDQNSGGFFVALLHKQKDFEWKYGSKLKQEMGLKPEEEIEDRFVEENMGQVNELPKCIDEPDDVSPPQMQESEGEEEEICEKQETLQKETPQEILEKKEQQVKEGKRNKKVKVSKYDNFQKLDEEQFLNIQRFYGLDDYFRGLLYVRDNLNARKKVLLVSEGIKNFLDYDSAGKIKLVNMGCQVFERGRQSFAGVECLYRLCQDGIHFMLDHLKYRKVKVPLSFFRKAISLRTLRHDQIEEESVRKPICQMTQGSFCLYIDEEINGTKVIDVLVGQNFKNSLHLMISKEDTASFAIRYL